MLGVGAALGPSAALPYVSEMAHPSFRGAMTGVYTTFYFVGAIPGTFIPYGTSFIESTQAWRIPLWLQMSFSGIVLVSCFFLPEVRNAPLRLADCVLTSDRPCRVPGIYSTPFQPSFLGPTMTGLSRWLMANGKREEALAVMAHYHGEGSSESPIVELEYREMLQEISQTGADKRWWDFRELFNTREVRYRTMLTVVIAVFGQWVGNGPVSYYYPQMLSSAGIDDVHLQLLLQGMQSVVSFIGALIGAAYTDRWGRRPQLMVGTGLIVVLYAIITALNATNIATGTDGTTLAKNAGQAKAEIAMIFLFSFVFAVAWTPMQGESRNGNAF